MPHPVFDRRSIRELDRLCVEQYAMPSIVLMENAGVGVARLALDLLRDLPARAIICAGTGNNAGDGFVVARHLHNHGVDVRIILAAGDCPARFSPDARGNLEICRRMGVPMEIAPDARTSDPRAASADWGDGLVVDGLLGTGLDRPPEGPMRSMIERINAWREAGGAGQAGGEKRRVLAIDLPSGMDADTGGGVCVQADVTATLVGWKRGFLNADALASVGRIEIVDIGAPKALVERLASWA